MTASLMLIASLSKAESDPQPIEASAEQPQLDRGAELFREGRKALKEGDYARACSKFEASHDLDPALGTLLNLAVCYERRGHLRKARNALERFLQLADTADDRRQHATDLLRNVDERTPRIQLRIADSPASGARVFVDDDEIPRDQWHAAIPVDPGTHSVIVQVPGRPDLRRAIDVPERESRTAVFELPDSHRRDPRRTPPVAASSQLPASFYVPLGVGIAGLAGAVASGILVVQQRRIVDEHCTNKRCDPEGLSAVDRGKRFATINTVALPVGIAGMAVAGYVFFDMKHRDANRAIGVALSPSHTVISAHGNF